MQDRIELFVPLSQAAEMLDCSLRQIMHLIDEGKIEFIRLPSKRIRVSKTSLLDYQGLVGRAMN